MTCWASISWVLLNIRATGASWCTLGPDDLEHLATLAERSIDSSTVIQDVTDRNPDRHIPHPSPTDPRRRRSSTRRNRPSSRRAVPLRTASLFRSLPQYCQ